MDIEQNQDGHSEYMHAETSNDLSEVLGNDRGKYVVSYVNMKGNDESSHHLVFNIQTPDLNEVFPPDDHIGGPSAVHNSTDMDFTVDDPPSPEFIEATHAPSTPGLLDTAIPVNVQEYSSLSPQDKISPFVLFEENKIPTSINEEVGCPDATMSNTHKHSAPAHPISTTLAQMVPPMMPASILTEPQTDSVALLSSAHAVNDNGPIHEAPTEPESVNGAQSFSLSPLVFANPNQHSKCSQCSFGGLAATDAINASDITHAVSVNPQSTSISHHSLTPHCSDGFPSAPDVAHVESPSMRTDSFQTVPICGEADKVSISNQIYNEGITREDIDLTSDMPTNNKAGSSDINSNPFMTKSGMPNTGNQDHVRDAQSCPSSSEFRFRSCTSHLNEITVSSSEDMISTKSRPEISFSEAAGTSDMPTMEKTLHLNRSSTELQDEFPLQKSTCVNNPVELLHNCTSKEAQMDTWNCTSSSQFPEPEKMLLAPFGYDNLPNGLGQQTADRVVTESDGSVDRIRNLSGQKHHSNRTPAMQNDRSTEVSGIHRKRRYNKYIPEDDDLLASILDGRTPSLMMGTTPLLPKANSVKRPRLTSRVGLPKKRKVLLDDIMVLHADVIRQQLINTEDIRRLRKKAPCTRPEIWRIQKSLLEDDIFSETVFTDASVELNNLQVKSYELAQNVRPTINGQHISIETSENVEIPRGSEIFRETSEREMAVQSSALLERGDVEMQGSLVTVTLTDECGKYAIAVDEHQQLGSLLPSVQVELLANNQTSVSTSEVYINESTGVEPGTNSPLHSGNECPIQSDSIIISKVEECVHECGRDNLATNYSPHSRNECDIQTCSELGEKLDNGCFSLEHNSLNEDTALRAQDAYNDTKPASIMAEGTSEDMVHAVSSNYPEGQSNAGKTEEVENLVLMPNSHILEVGPDMPVDLSTATLHTNSSMPEAALICGEPPKSGQVIAGEESLKEKVIVEERPTSEVHCTERPNMHPDPLLVATETERVPSAVGENSCVQEFNLDGGLVVESFLMDVAAARESSDFCSAIEDLDTEFLNVDDGIDYEEEADNDVQNPEEAQSLENSGWSSRTRGVARYLKAMFDEESGHMRKSVAVDHLLAGKTRKEASRMFFETLVLKTRDYIHVEQERSFDYISIKPRMKLLKSEL